MIREALYGKLRRMHHVQRYSSLPVITRENVAEHSWQVAMLSLMMALEIRERFAILVDIQETVTRAICHDVSEALSGDIIRSYKHSSPKMVQACQDADVINMEKLVQELGAGLAARHVQVQWRDAKRPSLEGDIVSLADMLCVVSYCVEERAMGNTKLDNVLRVLYEETLAGYHDHPQLGHFMDEIFPSKCWDDPYLYSPEGAHV